MGGEIEEDQVEKKKVVASMFKSLQTREALCKLSIELGLNYLDKSLLIINSETIILYTTRLQAGTTIQKMLWA